MIPHLRKDAYEAMRRDDDAEEGRGPPAESAYEHVGMDNLSSLGDASASLGLISTLVLSICIGSIIQLQTSSHPVSDLFLTLGTIGSLYTTTYSLLEYYYVQSLKSLDRSIAQRHFHQPGPVSSRTLGASQASSAEDPRDSSAVESDPSALRKQESVRGLAGIAEDRARLVVEVEETFAAFNEMRMWARNSMWISLVSLIGAAMCKIDPLGEVAPSWSPAVKTACFFGVLTSLFAVGYCVGFQSRDVKWYICIGAGAGVLSFLGGTVVHTAVNLARIAAGGFLLASVFVVPVTVRTFRLSFMGKLQRNASIY